MRQALVITDNLNNPESYTDLKDNLIKNNFKLVEIESVRHFETAKQKLDINKPCLFYKNCYTRFDVPEVIWDFHESNLKLDFLTIGSEVVSFRPNAVIFKNNTLLMPTNNVNSFAVSSVYGKKVNIVNKFKNEDRPLIFLSTFNRDLYLRLTLNSFIFSLNKPVDLKIFLNEATPEVKQVALDFAKKHDFIEVFDVQKNSYFSVYNLAVQWFKPKHFFIMEDDFILSPSTKHFFPDWPYQFIDRLHNFDAVAWSIYADNCHYNVPFIRNVPDISRSDWEIGDLNKILCGAQCLAVTTKYWLEYLFKIKGSCQYHVPLDQHLLKGNFCTPALKTYHIGWNQEMEGFVSVNAGNRFGSPPIINKLTSLKTNETKEFNLLDIYSYNILGDFYETKFRL